MLPYNRKMKPRSQELRNGATPEENKLWYEFLRKHECPFARQKPIDNYIVDFLCPSKKLVIEVDGMQHYTDDARLRVLRFANAEISDSFDKVCAAIQAYIDSTD